MDRLQQSADNKIEAKEKILYQVDFLLGVNYFKVPENRDQQSKN